MGHNFNQSITKINSYNYYNANAKSKIDIIDLMKQQLEQTNTVFSCLSNLKSEIIDTYVSIFKEKLREVLNNYQIDLKFLQDIDDQENLSFIKEDPDLKYLIMLFICKNLEISNEITSREFESSTYNQTKASRRLSYYRVKSLVDVLGKKEATRIYKEAVACIIQNMKENSIDEQPPQDPREVTRSASRERYISRNKKTGFADFTLGVFDDYKEIYRFDRCVVHEVLKDLNDPDIAFLSSCYIMEHPDFNKGEIIHLRRTQTLFHSDFCDEFYWNNEVYPQTEQPTTKFTRNLSE